MTTIREVAERAGVSLTTVSHVVNRSRFVSEDTRKRVLEAMQDLNYRPNAVARSLRSGKTHTLGLILPDSSNPFFAEIGREVEKTAFTEGYSVMLCNTERDLAREELYVRLLSDKQVDGVIFVAAGEQIDSLAYLLEQHTPIVVVDRDLSYDEVDAVLTDNLLGGYQATQHLIALGHQRIACISGPVNGARSMERVSGYRRALEEYGIAEDPALLLIGDYHPQSGRDAAHHLLSLDNRPTAIFACNDLMAIGVIRAVTAERLSIPDNVAVVGFDNIELANYTTPSLTTVAQPITEIGALSASLVIQRIAEPHRPAERPKLPTQLIMRESTVKSAASPVT
jgi:LacI family transcriptional regulator